MRRITFPSPVESPWPQNNTIPALLAEAPARAKGGIVCLHGYTGRKETMTDIIAGLVFSGYCVLAPDLPLHGERALGPSGSFEYPFYGDPTGIVKAFENALADIAACAAWLQSHLGVGTPLGITGYSLGGCLTILAMAKMPERFAAGISIVGAAKLAKLVMTSSICGDIQADLREMGYDADRLEPILRSVEATEHAGAIHDLLMLGGEDDVIVPGNLVRETFAALPHETNELVMFENCGHFPPLEEVARRALPFLAQRHER